MTDGPLIVQSDKTLLLEVDHPLADECRHSHWIRRAAIERRGGKQACQSRKDRGIPYPSHGALRLPHEYEGEDTCENRHDCRRNRSRLRGRRKP